MTETIQQYRLNQRGREVMTRIWVMLPESMKHQLDAYARRQGESVAVIVRQAIRNQMKSE